MELKSLFDKLIKFDKNGEIVNELISQNIILVEDVVDFAIKSNNFDYIYFISKFINGVQLEKLENTIILGNNLECVYLFARDIKGVNIKKLEDKVIESGNLEYIYLFARDVNGANIERLEDIVIKKGRIDYIYYFIGYVKGANLDKLEDVIINSNNALYIYNYVTFMLINGKKIDNVMFNKLTDAIINTKDVMYIYRYALDFSEKLDVNSINKLAFAFRDIAIEKNDIKLIRGYVRTIPVAPFDCLDATIRLYNDGYSLKKTLSIK